MKKKPIILTHSIEINHQLNPSFKNPNLDDKFKENVWRIVTWDLYEDEVKIGQERWGGAKLKNTVEK